MNNDSKIKLYIKIEKALYYPGELLSASILIYAKEQINQYKVIITIKGKQLISALDTNNNENDEDISNSSSYSSDSNYSSRVKIEEKSHIFKLKKELIISKNNFINEGKYSFPFKLQLPKDIQGTFLYLEKNIYAEIQYYIKVKLDGFDIKSIAPIVIRQKGNVFNYPIFSEYEKNIKGNCYLKLATRENFTKTEAPIKLTVNINNDTKQIITPVYIEIYRTLWLKDKKKIIKKTEIVGTYKANIQLLQKKITQKIYMFFWILVIILKIILMKQKPLKYINIKK